MDVNPSMGALTQCEVLVVGAGFSGMSMLYRLRKAGYTAKVFESGGDFVSAVKLSRRLRFLTRTAGWRLVLESIREFWPLPVHIASF
jgi:flavin-dependent dehydrogenase